MHFFVFCVESFFYIKKLIKKISVAKIFVSTATCFVSEESYKHAFMLTKSWKNGGTKTKTNLALSLRLQI